MSRGKWAQLPLACRGHKHVAAHASTRKHQRTHTPPSTSEHQQAPTHRVHAHGAASHVPVPNKSAGAEVRGEGERMKPPQQHKPHTCVLTYRAIQQCVRPKPHTTTHTPHQHSQHPTPHNQHSPQPTQPTTNTANTPHPTPHTPHPTAHTPHPTAHKLTPIPLFSGGSVTAPAQPTGSRPSPQ